MNTTYLANVPTQRLQSVLEAHDIPSEGLSRQELIEKILQEDIDDASLMCFIFAPMWGI